MQEAVIVDCLRTAAGKAPKGTLRNTRPDDMAAAVFSALLQRYPQVPKEEVDDVVLGCAMPEGEQGMNMARISALRAGLPDMVPGVTINRFCSSGLQAIATAKRLGAIVEAFDVRSAAREEVLSLGAKFVEVEGAVENKAAGGYAIEQTDEFKAKQAQLIHDHAAQSDIVICTAQIPGRKAPLLVKKETVAAMKPGSVIVDLAASTGGNCELTENGTTIEAHGVKIIGQSNLPTTIARDASALFSKNMLNFLKLVAIKGALTLNFEDDIIAATCVTHSGEIVSQRLKA